MNHYREIERPSPVASTNVKRSTTQNAPIAARRSPVPTKHQDAQIKHSATCASALQRTQRRWQIRMEQLQSGGEPCFASDRRYCDSNACRWHEECQQLRADWLR